MFKKKSNRKLNYFEKKLLSKKYEYSQISNDVDIYLQYQSNKFLLTRISRA